MVVQCTLKRTTNYSFSIQNNALDFLAQVNVYIRRSNLGGKNFLQGIRSISKSDSLEFLCFFKVL